MPKYISAKDGPHRSVIYTDTDGRQGRFEGGSRPWRNQNPGNLVPGAVSKRNGAIGKAGGFAIFPSYEAGHTALLDSLKNMNGNKDIAALMAVYAPPKDNPTRKYIAFVRKKTGVKGSKKLKDFSASEFEKLWRVIEQMEGWGKTGKIIECSTLGQVTGVRKDKRGTIRSYQIEGYVWVSKSKGIELAKTGKVDAVVATSPRRNQFLRARPNSKIDDNLGRKG